MNKFIARQSCLLFLTALIWGVAFVAQSAGMDYVGPFTFNAVRSLIGGIVLIPCIWILDRWKKKSGEAQTEVDGQKFREQSTKVESDRAKRDLIIGGTSCGVLLFIASNFQQFGIQYTTVGKAGFVTALYIVIVPILGIFLHRKAGAKIWLGVTLALCGLYLLCMQGNFSLQKGDFLVLLCAFSFSFHILVVDYFSPKADGVKMSCIQFLVCGILSAICMFLFETPQISLVLAAWLPILYAGVMSCGVAYTLQIVGQKGMNPTIASLILSMESVVSVLAGWIILHETLSAKELMGCVLMFAAIILAQLPDRKRGEK
ncbi:MAG: DMT family transporter [Lachnospiraceae bacterium]|nr:DMT family transporter [Lachnospiraceae bacterium]